MNWWSDNVTKPVNKVVNNVADAVVDVVDAVIDVGKAVVDVVVDVVSGVVGFVTGVVTPQITGIPDTPSVSNADALRSQTVMIRSSISSRKLVYGKTKVSGTMLFAETSNSDKDLHICVSLASHEIDSVEEVFFNEQKVRSSALTDAVETAIGTTVDPNYSGNAWVTAHNGSVDQVADSNLVARTSATSAHRMRGISYLYTKLIYDQDKFSKGMPNISAVIRGKKVYDPRTNTYGYSNNAALCILDYLQDSRYGLDAGNDEIDFDSFKLAADICDEDVTLAAGGTEKRYTINGVVDTSKSPSNIIKELLLSCSGTVYYSNGKFKLRVGAYVTPTSTLSLDDITGGINITTRVSNQANFNAVKGVFLSPDDAWVPTDFPPITSEVFKEEDNSEERFVDLTFPYTTSSSMVQRLAKLALYRNREQLTMTVPCNLKAFKYEVGDTIKFTNDRFGFDEKVFEVLSWEFSQSYSQNSVGLGINLTLKETSSTIYEWDAIDERELTRNNTNLPTYQIPGAPSIDVNDELRSYNEEVITTLTVDITSTSPFVVAYEVQAQKIGTTTWINIGNASAQRYELKQVEDGYTYTVRARAVNSLNVTSPWTTVSHQVVGKTAPPSDVTGLRGNLIGNQMFLSWNPISDLDLSYYRVRFASSDGDMEYRNSVSLVDKVSRPATSVFVPARNGTYFVKAVDKLGLASENAATIVLDSNISAVENLNVVQTLTEHPNFDGTFDDVVEIDELDRLVLNTSLNFDDITSLFDDAVGLFDGGSSNVDALGYYYFGNSTDLGGVFVSRVTANIEHVRLDYVELFDSVAGLFDSRTGYFDGDVNAFDDTDAIMEYRSTLDDPAGTPEWSAWTQFFVADIKARAIEFRCKLTTTDSDATPAVSQLSVTVDIPDRVVGEKDIQTTAASYSVTYADGAFYEVPALGIGAQDLQTGDYYEITSKTTSGFVIIFKNSSGTPVARSFDYTAKGYGRVIN